MAQGVKCTPSSPPPDAELLERSVAGPVRRPRRCGRPRRDQPGRLGFSSVPTRELSAPISEIQPRRCSRHILESRCSARLTVRLPSPPQIDVDGAEPLALRDPGRIPREDRPTIRPSSIPSHSRGGGCGPATSSPHGTLATPAGPRGNPFNASQTSEDDILRLSLPADLESELNSCSPAPRLLAGFTSTELLEAATSVGSTTTRITARRASCQKHPIPLPQGGPRDLAAQGSAPRRPLPRLRARIGGICTSQ